MPFLHGFRRIIYEYQPLVDAVLCVVGLEEERSTEERNCNPDVEDSVCGSLVELLEKESQSAVFEEGVSYALFKVAERGLVNAAKVLLRYGADLNFEDPVSYYNPLHIAVLRNKPNMVRMLAEHGADINKRDRIHESSPLDLASEEAERVPCMRTLLDMGADVNAKDKHGKSPLLHALASSDGLTVHNIENIRLLLQRGADIHAATIDGETAVSSLVLLVKEALSASVEDAAEIGRFCLRATRLLLAQGADPSSCLATDGEEDGEHSLTATSLEHFDRLFPLAVLLLQSGASFYCSHHGATCWTGYGIMFRRLQAALLDCSDTRQAAELLEQAEVLLDLARVSSSSLALPLDLRMPDQAPHAQALQDLHRRMVEQETSPPPLRGLCRASIRGHLQPWPLDDRVKALPLPDRLKEYLLPEHTLNPKPGWDCFMPEHSLQLRH
ncbi:ankyrin repeat and SOCS box protein 6 isoform X1 [Esox lucius]|nr:ankyrin repeat and SOCS box protein 6 isoform X1 [Esox lucius]XP_010894011.1 ankyrin repeat and SOCS box protein 6 isoform X1 [Esox lucius]XP_010894012.1 ankyrin repeat and SOCS box protein 6 isoform X1 [Esox lucius]